MATSLQALKQFTQRFYLEIALVVVLKIIILMTIKHIWFNAPSPWHQEPQTISQHIFSAAENSQSQKSAPLPESSTLKQEPTP